MLLPATFCNLMNDVLKEYVDPFVVVYLDDGVVYSQSLEDHVDHLRKVLAKLREDQLYVKMEKFEFAQKEIMFLGHIVSAGHVKMDQQKVKALRGPYQSHGAQVIPWTRQQLL